MPCLGPRCAAFVQNTDENGNATGTGACADTVQAIALVRLADLIESYFSVDDDEEKVN
jgi:hypothetical protein